MATAPSPNDLTRQQLDELDALLQRMLALPLNPPDPAPHPGGLTPTGLPVPPLPLPPESVPAAKNWRIDPPAPVAAPPPVPHAGIAPNPGGLPSPGSPEPRPQVPPPEPERVVIATPRVPPPEPEPPVRVSVPAPLPAPERKPVPIPEPVVARPAPPPAPPAVPGPPIPVALWPLIAFNWTIDRLLGLFGPPGWFLRGGFGKNLLGVTGVGLLAYTAVRLAQQQGWVSLPFPLPWPP